MKNTRLQAVAIDAAQLDKVKGGYKHVGNAAESASFIGTAVDIRLLTGTENAGSTFNFGRQIEINLR